MTLSPLSVWIVIPTYNRSRDLVECLNSVIALKGGPYSVLIVDNGSTDDTLHQVDMLFPNCLVKQLHQNTGAAEAANIGFSHALANGADLILRLDSDTIVAPDFLIELIHELEKEPKVGILTGKIFYYSNPSIIWSIGAIQKKFDLGAIEIARDREDSPRFQAPQDVDLAWAAGLLLTNDVLNATGGFDPAFFVYYEEADLCLRAKKLGYRIRSVPSAKMWHKIGQSERSSWIARNWSRSKIIYFRKHSHGLHKMLLILYAYFYAVFHALKKTKRGGNRGPLLAALKGLTQGLLSQIQHNENE